MVRTAVDTLRSLRLPLLTAAILAVVTAVPYAAGYLAQPPGQVFMGFFYLGDDANTYLAKMREGWEGSWAWTNRYTTEASPAAYLFMFWILLGHLAWLTHLPLLVSFHLARAAAAFALLLAAWFFFQRFLPEGGARRFAFLFCAFGLGCGFLIQALGHPVVFGNQTDTLDWRMPELSVAYSVLALPHFAWSAAFQAAGIVLTLRAAERGSLGLGLLAGISWLGQASIHPQMPILMAGALGAALLLRPVTPRGYAAAALAFLVPAPYIAYSYLAFVGNPEVQRWTFHSKNALPPEGVSFLFALLPQLLLAVTGLPGAVRRRSREDLFLLAWLLLLVVILYFPNPAGDLRRRFLDGIYLPLQALGARGLYEAVLPRLSGAPRNLVPFAYASFSTVGTWFLVLAPLLLATSPLYVTSSAEYGGLRWLGGQPAGVVLSSPKVGLFVPAYSPDTVYVGHYDETFGYYDKAQRAYRLLTGLEDVAAFASSNHVRYVVWSDEFGGSPPSGLGEPAYDTSTFKIYRLY
ncbi:MAG TPA: hypothetical protein VK131_02475 [Candidatus Acidoferrales bacterium]|nr:hypothetical protein [Candidatus Acidoferrales bacterium]